ncbi:MAG: hypothetical protein OXF11_16155 [Deltaproteobacteria bacterium]|nr:hypothetical protein [Deltaproteobacteria bacterium]
MKSAPRLMGDGTALSALVAAIRDLRGPKQAEVRPVPEGPALYLCCAEEAGRATGMYRHLMQRESVLPYASDPGNGARLWEASENLVAQTREHRVESTVKPTGDPP